MEDNQVIVIWNWTWLAAEIIESSDYEECLSESDSIQSIMENSEDEPDDGIPAITDSVVFKCIGCHKENWYQELLALAQRKRARDGIEITT